MEVGGGMGIIRQPDISMTTRNMRVGHPPLDKQHLAVLMRTRPLAMGIGFTMGAGIVALPLRPRTIILWGGQ